MDNAALDQMVQKYEGCVFVAFADLDVGIPLRTAAIARVGQEVLNTLCQRAGSVFAANSTYSSLAIEATDTVLHVFVRGPSDTAIAFIAEIDHSVPLDEFIVAAKTCVRGDA